MNNLIRVGIVSSVDADTCTAKVAFTDQANTVSYDLPIIVRGSLSTKDYWLPDPNEQVLCLFLPTGISDGFILGAFYSEEDKPPVKDQNKRNITFADGTKIDYDQTNHKLTIDAKGTVEILAADSITITGDVIVNGTVTASGMSASGDIQASSIAVSGNISAGGNITSSQNINASNDVTAGTISLKSHKHYDLSEQSVATGKSM